ERHPTRRAREERRAELVLERADALAERGGGEVDVARGAPERERPRRLDEATERVEVRQRAAHRAAPPERAATAGSPNRRRRQTRSPLWSSSHLRGGR